MNSESLDLLAHVPAIIAILSDNRTINFAEALEFEKWIADHPKDVTTRLVYADWLQERSCKKREQQVRQEAHDVARGVEVNRWTGSIDHSRELTTENYEVEHIRIGLIRSRLEPSRDS